MKKIILLIVIGAFSARLSAQTKVKVTPLSKLQTWQLLDYQQDTVYGASVNRAYIELLKGKKSTTVIVAVIDEGVDITHEDLQGHIWTNKREIPGNSIDDDKNGYTDDVHGWNFLGGKNGKMMDATSSEADREYVRLLPKYRMVKDSVNELSNKEYRYFLRIREKHLNDSTSKSLITSGKRMRGMQKLARTTDYFEKMLGKKHVYLEDLNSFQPKDSIADISKKYLLKVYRLYPDIKNSPMDSVVAGNQEDLDNLLLQQQMYTQLGNDPYQLRKEIVGDDPFDINDRNYGNNIVGDQFADHGTHCAGIIAAVRDNNIGMNGVAQDVFIMPVRAVNGFRYGDESDKDIALSIRYAVDNGAKIISMSFGKQFSPQKQWVDDAVKYAEQKGVLLIHGAGNDGLNADSTAFYPDANFLNSPARAKNIITVGAISRDTGAELPASFSNYSQKEVDVFAPGVDIYSTVPGNKYEWFSGTSMATPVVAGVAALIWEYYPRLTALQVKEIILRSVTPLKGKMVYKPGTKELVDFATLCSSGGTVNAYNALRLAASYK